MGESELTVSTIAEAWGWLWHITSPNKQVIEDRHLLAKFLDKDLKAQGIQAAKNRGARVGIM